MLVISQAALNQRDQYPPNVKNLAVLHVFNNGWNWHFAALKGVS